MEIKTFAVHDGPGIRTTFFLKGCPLRCLWCHNPEGISSLPQIAYFSHKCVACGQCLAVCPVNAHEIIDGKHFYYRERCITCGDCVDVCLGEAMVMYGRPITLDEAMETALADKPFYESSGGGVTLSGGEPLLQADFVHTFLKALNENGIHTAIDTSGAVPWRTFEQIIGLTDLFLYDIKHIDSQAHRKLTGVRNELILENLRLLSDARAAIEVRIPLIPGINNDDVTLIAIAELLSSLSIMRVKVLPYHALARSKYEALGMVNKMPETHSPSDSELNYAVEILRRYGNNAVSGRD